MGEYYDCFNPLVDLRADQSHDSMDHAHDSLGGCGPQVGQIHNNLDIKMVIDKKYCIILSVFGKGGELHADLFYWLY